MGVYATSTNQSKTDEILHLWFIRIKGNFPLGGKNILRTVKTAQNYILSATLMDTLSDKEDGSELLAIIRMRDDNFHTIKLSENPLLVLFDFLSNKGNPETLIRSCDAFSTDGIITGHA